MKNIFKSLLIIIIVIFTISCEKDIDDYRVKFKNYLEQENYVLAEKLADTIIKKYPQKAYPHYMKGVVLARLRHYKDAEKSIKKSLQLYKDKTKKEPQYSIVEVHTALSFTLQNQSKYIESINHAEKAISIDSTYVKAYNMLAKDYYKLQNYSETIKYCNKALRYKDKYKTNEDLILTYKYKALAFNKLKKYNDAITVLQKSVAVDSTNAETFRSIAINYFKLDKNKQAYKYIKKAEKYNNGRFEDLFDIKYNILGYASEYNFAITKVEKEINNCSQDSVFNELQILKMDIYYAFGHSNKIINQVSKMRENGNQDKYLLHLRALSYLALGEFEKAKQDLQEFNHPFFYDINMILLNLLKGNKNKAIQYYSNLNMTKAELYNSQYFQDISFMIGRYKPFKKLLTDFIESRPE